MLISDDNLAEKSSKNKILKIVVELFCNYLFTLYKTAYYIILDLL